jgi:hypothetical protein
MSDSLIGSGFSLAVSCEGQCLEKSRKAFAEAREISGRSGGGGSELDKRFQYLLDVSGHDVHKEAEIMLEHALALYETVYGQEHSYVAKMLLELSALYAIHGNLDYADYLSGWANDILQANRPEPTHEFFQLFNMSEGMEESGRG